MAPSARNRHTVTYLGGLDRGEIVDGRILQIWEPDTIRVAMGPGILIARATGGKPILGTFRFEVSVPGERPVLRMTNAVPAGEMDFVADPSLEKTASRMVRQVDYRA